MKPKTVFHPPTRAISLVLTFLLTFSCLLSATSLMFPVKAYAEEATLVQSGEPILWFTVLQGETAPHHTYEGYDEINGEAVYCTDFWTDSINGATYYSYPQPKDKALKIGLYEKFLYAAYGDWSSTDHAGYLQFFVWNEYHGEDAFKTYCLPDYDGMWDTYHQAQEYYEANYPYYDAWGTEWYSDTSQTMCSAPHLVEKGSANIKKTSADPALTEGNDCYSFEGAQFTFYDEDGEVAGSVTSDAEGNTNTIPLSAGTYTVEETVAPKGYLSADSQTVTITEGQTSTVTFEDSPSYDPLSMFIGKYDGEKTYRAKNLPQGAASLEGAEFSVAYYDTVEFDSYDELVASGTAPERSWIVRTDKDGYCDLSEQYIVSGDDVYRNPLGKVSLPRGTVVVYESKAPAGYELNPAVNFQKIQEDPLSGVTTFQAPVVPDSVFRSDLEFTKKAENGDRLANVAFKITSKTTGESHVIVTDENGYFSSASSWNRHTNNTNQNDWALEAATPIDSSKLDNTCGLWFGLNSTTPEPEAAELDMIAPDDGVGALPYDTYELEELRCSANDGYQLINTSVCINRDGKTYDFGTLDDIEASLSTTAYDPDDGDSYIGVGETSVADKVMYENVIASRTYKLVGELHDAASGEAIKDSHGTPITAEKTFTAHESSGFEDLQFPVSTYGCGGKTFVVYEYLYDASNSLIAKHNDQADVSQQVKVVEPLINTTATDAADGDKHVSTDDEVTVNDTVAYGNLIPGKEYTLKGTLYNKATGDALTVDGLPVTSETTFTPESADGTATVTFTFDSLALPNATQLVAFESLEVGGTEVAVHTDINDMSQTVTLENPRITTTATDGVDSDKNVVTDDESTIVDTVTYTNLVPGKEYTLKGTLYNKATGDALTVDGLPVTSETTFTPESANGTATVTFTFDSRAIEDDSQLVAFESLEKNGKEIAAHTDAEDVAQTVHIIHPDLATTATDGVDSDKNVVTDDESTIVDTVTYTNLVPGKEYTLKGTLYNKATGDALTVDGLPVTSETTFTPESANGTATVTFTFDSRAIEDDSQLVAFESLEKNGKEIAVHADLEDDNQTTTAHVTTIATTATDGGDGDKTVVADGTTTVTDAVEYNNALSGTLYTMAGILVDADTGLPILSGEGADTYSDKDVAAFWSQLQEALGIGTAPVSSRIDTDALQALFKENADLLSCMVTQTAEVTPTDYNGTLSMDFSFNGNDVIDRLSGETKNLVVFEAMFKGSLHDDTGLFLVAHECDVKSTEQTVEMVPSGITTMATDKTDGDHKLLASQDSVIVDTITYQNLIPGKEYLVHATLFDKATGKPLSVNDKNVTAELKFTPNSDKGTVEIELGEFDSTNLIDSSLVVFEEVHKQDVNANGTTEDVIVAEHKDINDTDQTVTVTNTPPGTTFGKTGGSDLLYLLLIVGLASAGGVGIWFVRKSRKDISSEDTEASED